jgi:hypothetical protein
VTIIDPCPTATYTLPTTTTQRFVISQAATVSWSVAAFTSDVLDSLCGAFAYTVTYSDGTSVDTTLFTVDSVNLDFSVFTSDYDLADVYYIMISGYQGTYSSLLQYVIVEVDVIDNCRTTPIFTTAISDQIYTVGFDTLNIKIPYFTEDRNCGKFTYTVLSNGAYLDDNLMNLRKKTDYMQLSVYTDDNIYAEVYDITVEGDLPGLYPSETISFTITILNNDYLVNDNDELPYFEFTLLNITMF